MRHSPVHADRGNKKRRVAASRGVWLERNARHFAAADYHDCYTAAIHGSQKSTADSVRPGSFESCTHSRLSSRANHVDHTSDCRAAIQKKVQRAEAFQMDEPIMRDDPAFT